MEQKFALSRKIFIFDNIAGMMIGVVCGGSYLAGLLSSINVPVYLNGLISSMGLLTGAFQILGAVVLQKHAKRKKPLLFGLGFLRIAFAFIFIVPWLFGVNNVSVWIVVTLYALGNIAGAATNPGLLNWMTEITPQADRGKFFSIKERYSLIGAVATVLFLSWVLSRPQFIENRISAFAVIGAIMLCLAVADVFVLPKLFEPDRVLENSDKNVWVNALAPLWDKSFRSVLLLTVFWQIASGISVSFIGVYYVDVIKIDYAIIGIMGIAGTAVKALMVTAGSKLADRCGWEKTLAVSLAVVALSLLIQIGLSPENYLLLYALSVIISNIGYSCLGIALLNIQFNHVKPADKTNHIAICGAVGGLSGFGATLIGAFCINYMGNLGLGTMVSMRMLLTASALLMFLICFYIKRFVKSEKG